jgi:hypothetical protein
MFELVREPLKHCNGAHKSVLQQVILVVTPATVVTVGVQVP